MKPPSVVTFRSRTAAAADGDGAELGAVVGGGDAGGEGERLLGAGALLHAATRVIRAAAAAARGRRPDIETPQAGSLRGGAAVRRADARDAASVPARDRLHCRVAPRTRRPRAFNAAA